MSYILDALKRAEAERERERGAVPGLHAQPVPLVSLPDARTPGRRSAALAALLAVVAAAAAAGVAWRFVVAPTAPAEGVAVAQRASERVLPAASAAAEDDTPTSDAGAQASRDSLAPPDSTGPAPRTGQPNASPSATQQAAPSLRTSPRSDTPAPAQRTKSPGAAATPALTDEQTTTFIPSAPPRPAASNPARVAAAPAAGARRTAPAASTPAVLPAEEDDMPAPGNRRSTAAVATVPAAPGEKSSAAPADRIYRQSELPAAIRGQLPALAVGGSMYSENAASRMLILNGQLLHEGERAAPDLVLERIGPTRAVLRFKGYRYEIAF